MGDLSPISEVTFSLDEQRRYSRQIILPEIGFEGQKKLSSSSVLVVGVGGIGSSVLMYLAGMGIGRLGVIDGDKIEIENLHRQVIHKTTLLGTSKVNCARDFISALNPHVQIIGYEAFINFKNAEEIIKDYNFVVDGSDNPVCRYIVNDACRKLNVILISGAAVKWEGQVTVLGYNDGPCYRCLYPQCPSPSEILSCGSNGVVSTVPGTIGIILATQVLKLILKFPEESLFSKKIFVINLKDDTYKVYHIGGKKQNCIICKNPAEFDIKNFDYDGFVGTGSLCQQEDPTFSISWRRIQLQDLLLDVRSKEQQLLQPVPDAYHLPLQKLLALNKEQLIDELGQNGALGKDLYVFCRSGFNSKIAVKKLREEGISCYNILGGINARGPSTNDII